MRFLDEHGARDTIRRLIASSGTARLAVAFWGDTAIGHLGLDRPGLDLSIICNLDSGACNPAEIRKLGALTAPKRLRSDPRLHAKVYWTPKGAVVGSSNASTNGLAVEGGPLDGWAEANVLIEEPEVLKKIEEWFDLRAGHAYEIGEDDLQRAESLWKVRRRGAAAGARLTGDLLAAYRGSPSHPVWRTVRLAIFTSDLDAAGKAEWLTAVAADPVLENWGCYQDWNAELRSGDWLLDINLSGGKPALEDFYSVPTPEKVETANLSFVSRVTAITLPAFGRLHLSADSKRALEAVAPALLQAAPSKDGVIVDLPDAMARIDGRPPAGADADLAGAFETALLTAYAEAKEIGYTPNRFLDLVHRLGGVGAARRLLRPGPPPLGLSRLALENRLDLSIEHLALQDRWRHLFSADELRVAAQRLGRKDR